MILWYFYLFSMVLLFDPTKMASGTLNTCGTFIDFRVSVLRYSYYLRYCYLIAQSSWKYKNLAGEWIGDASEIVTTAGTLIQFEV